jgi:catechol 2,3-dioxygenase-like lactoylglutathione lyase family enzyme
VLSVTNFVHVGLVVEDLDETIRFLTLLGFDCDKPGAFTGEWIDRIIALENVTVEVVMARAPDGSDMFEVVRFGSPAVGAQEPAPAANVPGLRHIAFTVDDLRGVVDGIREAGWDTVEGDRRLREHLSPLLHPRTRRPDRRTRRATRRRCLKDRTERSRARERGDW